MNKAVSFEGGRIVAVLAAAAALAAGGIAAQAAAQTDNVSTNKVVEVGDQSSGLGPISLTAAGSSLKYVAYEAISPQTSSYFDSREFGDEIVMNTPSWSGGNAYLTDFILDYYANFTAFPGRNITLSLYAMDGTPIDDRATPGTLLFTTTSIISSSGHMEFDLTQGGAPLVAPAQIAWTVKITGLTESNVGLWVADDVPVGGNFGDFWVYDEANGWELHQLEGANSDFQAQVLAVPEPSVWALMIGGGALFLAVRRRRR
ncbi:MAG: PEP-CTERM sorting domain-containing protein [Verrucomicrobia bacterium]|nr:PEP-CTERM sorting domain-containing protein [Verrucomicrobiota bacterium]